ncbi:hypothetical protein [Ktedonospora formicarum]|uniref:Uncharacterized protein n=1 Tax=Ktedonospora formicarum TaxID=2778364 RepID=A0A8J3HXA1_9CHLR|nr:hypothetical protein [Ktedonospora formicarum]GHO44931.1 hypothetical protein KSX_30940 [Ktedonospora formicarum]
MHSRISDLILSGPNETNEINITQEQIQRAQDQIKRLDELLTNPVRPLTKETEGRYLTKVSETENAIQRLQRKLQSLQEN